MSHLKIRRMTPEDLMPLYRLLSDPETMRYLEPPFSLEKTENFHKQTGLSPAPLIFAIADDQDPFLGYVICHEYDPDSMEIGWVLKPEIRGRGIARTLTGMLVRMAAQAGKDTVIECVPEQTITVHIAENSGFTDAGMRDGLRIFRRSREGKAAS